MNMSELEFEFEHRGRMVRPGAILHVAPHLWWRAGEQGAVERYYGDSVMLRHANGAVPTVPLHCLSWATFPETVAREELSAAGFTRPTARDVAVWMAARCAAPAAPTPAVVPEIDDPVTVPRGLLGAACSAINYQLDAPKVLAELRRYTVGDLSPPMPPTAAPAAPSNGEG